MQLSVPPLAALGGVVLLGEPLTLRLLLASVAILGGIALVTAEKSRAQGWTSWPPRLADMKSKDWRPTAFVDTAPGVVTEQEAETSRLSSGARCSTSCAT